MKILFLMTLFVAPLSFAQSFLPHDISILLPPPTRVPDPEAIHFDSFLTKYALQILPQLEPSVDLANQNKRLQIAAIRIDPPELRIVWQIWRRTHQGVEAVDAAVHSFHKIENYPLFARDLKRISALTRSDVSILTPLSIHPTLQREGMSGTYARELRMFLSKHAHTRNLFKLTFMAMRVAGTAWDFGGFHVSPNNLVPVRIAKVPQAGSQMFINNSFHEFSGGFGPAPQDQEDFNRLVSDSYKAQAKDPTRLRNVHATSRRIENPRLETPDTIDCVSCHLAQTARVWTENINPMLKRETQNKFTSRKYLLVNKTDDPTRTDNVHAFGYFLNMVTINQRTINDTAFTLEKMNR